MSDTEYKIGSSSSDEAGRSDDDGRSDEDGLSDDDRRVDEDGWTVDDGESDDDGLDLENSKNRASQLTEERVMGKRETEPGKVEYQIKWKGVSFDHCTWKLVETLDNCRDRVLEYENVMKLLAKTQNVTESGIPNTIGDVEVVDASFADGQIVFFLKYKHTKENRIVRAEVVNKEHPMMVINFYVNRLKLFDRADSTPVTEKSDRAEIRNQSIAALADLTQDGRVAEKIVCGIMMNDMLHFVLKWENIKEADLVFSECVYENYPQLAIEYFEHHIKVLGMGGKKLCMCCEKYKRES